MKRVVAVIVACGLVGLVGLAACASTRSLPRQGLQAIDRCVREFDRAGRLLPSGVDRAYVYARGSTSWLYFTHGDSGTFGSRSEDYRILLTCAVERSAGLSVVFLGEMMQDPIVDAAERGSFVTPEGTTELLFERVHGSFQFCCSQPFDSNNAESRK